MAHTAAPATMTTANRRMAISAGRISAADRWARAADRGSNAPGLHVRALSGELQASR